MLARLLVGWVGWCLGGCLGDGVVGCCMKQNMKTHEKHMKSMKTHEKHMKNIKTHENTHENMFNYETHSWVTYFGDPTIKYS